MNNVLKLTAVLLFILCRFQLHATPGIVGNVSGKLLLDDTWERQVYLSLVESFEKEFSFSNNMIVAKSAIDSFGNYKLSLDNLPAHWCLLRLHVVKKGFSPKYLVIGSREENYLFIIARRDSEIKLFNSSSMPIFENTKIEGAPYMETFGYIGKLAEYPNAIDYNNSLVEKEFIEDVVAEKLKVVADTCTNPLVSLYALYKTNFINDYQKNSVFYKAYLAKTSNENSPYFESFRRQFRDSKKFPWLLVIIIAIAVISGAAGFYIFKKRKPAIKTLSVQERKVLELLQQGKSNQEIADFCNIELSTTKSHVSSIYSKLNIQSRKQALDIKIK